MTDSHTYFIRVSECVKWLRETFIMYLERLTFNVAEYNVIYNIYLYLCSYEYRIMYNNKYTQILRVTRSALYHFH